MNIAIGIDPGIDTGGLSMIPENGEVKVIMTPRISAKGDIDLRAISGFFLDAADKIQEEGGGTLAIAVEDVHSIHNSSAASNFTFGGRRREPNALFAMMVEMMERYESHPDVRFMFEEVQPKTWQKELHTTADRVYTAAKLDTKATSIRCAIRLFPLVSFVKPWSGKGVQPTKIQDGMCDAILIAEYIRRKFKLF